MAPKTCAVDELLALVLLEVVPGKDMDPFPEFAAHVGFRTGTLCAVLLGAVMFSCSDESDAPAVDRATYAVLGGEPSPSDHDAVVLLRAEVAADAVFCSGTLVSPHILITAKHCVTATSSRGFKCRSNGELQQLGDKAGEYGAPFAPEQLAVYVGATPGDVPAARGAHVFVSPAENSCRDDVALVVVDRAIVVSRYPAVRMVAPIRLGELVTAIGYGIGPNESARVRREVASQRIIDVGSEYTSSDLATTPARTFVLPGGYLCQGDSGGPALSSESGALLGTYSRINGDCLDPLTRNTFIVTSKFVDLFEQAFRVTGERPVHEVVGDTPMAADAGAGAEGVTGDRGDVADVLPSGSVPSSLESSTADPQSPSSEAMAPVGPADGAFRCTAAETGGRSPTRWPWLLSVAVVAVGRRMRASCRAARRIRVASC